MNYIFDFNLKVTDWSRVSVNSEIKITSINTFGCLFTFLQVKNFPKFKMVNMTIKRIIIHYVYDLHFDWPATCK